MKLLYEPGDEIYFTDDYGGERWTIITIRKLGVVAENKWGERRYFGKRQIEPAPNTVINAKWLTRFL